jgi:hypothetical protein
VRPRPSSIGTSGIDAVLLEQIDRVDAAASQRGVGDLADVLWPTIEAAPIDPESNFVAITTRSRTGASASPISSSFVNAP